MSKPHLISFKTCPFVQRAVLALREKGVDFDITYIDLSDKPDWFLEISPRGKVPLLQVDGVVLFESQAITEYLDEVYPEPRLMPDDAVGRARDRAWFAFASEELFGRMYRLAYAKDQSSFDDALSGIREKLTRVAEELDGDWLSGDGSRFGMADVAFAPFFTRAELLEEQGVSTIPEDLDDLRAWGQRLLDRPAVKRSVPEDYRELELEGLERRGLSRFLN